MPTVAVRIRHIWRTTAFRLTASVVALFALVAVVFVGLVYWQINSLLTRQMADDAAREARQISEFARTSPAARLRELIEGRSRIQNKHLYLLVGPDSRRLAGNIGAWPDGVAADGGAAVFQYRDIANRAGLAVGVARRLPGGSQYVVARDAGVIETLSFDVRWWFIVGIGLMSALGLGVGYFASQTVMGRIAQITETGERIMTGRLSERIPLAGTGDELDDLASNLNRMLSRIEELMTSFREVSDNIAHDLKTPLNRLRNRAEEALADGRDGDNHRQSLERILEEADDLIRTFNALLQVARLEAGAVDETRETFDLAAAAQDLVELYAPVVEETGGSIHYDGEAGTMVHANRQLISQALTNLIENAMKYGVRDVTCSGGRTAADVRVGVTQGDGQVMLAVGDRGPGIRAEDRERALRRFGRLDSARSQPGTGLGLSLVGAVARLHGGAVELCDNGPGLVVRITLPREVSDGQRTS